MRAVAIVGALAMALGLLQAGVLLVPGRAVARRGRRFVRRDQRARARLLVVGDSSALGAGATSPEGSVAGRLAAALPGVTIGNLSRNGARTADVARLLHTLRRRTQQRGAPPYDALIVHTGGNDVLHWTALTRLDAALDRLVENATALATRVVVVTGGNLRLAPGIFPPFNWIWSWRQQRVRERFITHLRGSGVTYVDLFRSPSDDPTTDDPDRYFAADGLHPSDDNYELWAREILPLLAPVAIRAAAPDGRPRAALRRG